MRTVPIGVGATRDFIAEVARIAGVSPVLADAASRLPWYSRSVDSTYLTGKRVYVFGDATHALAAARVATSELAFDLVGLGTYSREFGREIRAEAARHGIEALVTDDYLDVEAEISALRPELILGTQMERHIAKRLGIPCAVISAPIHVQDFPARHSPQMGFEGANVLFDTWVHPLMMGLEEHLLHMFRGDFEFNDRTGSHLGKTHMPAAAEAAAAEPVLASPPRSPAPPRGTRSPNRSFARSPSSSAARPGATPNASLSSAASPPSPWTPSTMRKLISAADATPIRVAIVTLDNHLAGVVARARVRMAASLPGLDLSLHAASEWASDEGALARCRSAIDNADIILCSMLFMEEHVAPIIDNLRARRETCDAIVGCMSIPDVVNLTRLGRYRFGEKSGGALSFLKRLRGKSSPGGGSGAGQMRMLRRLPKILRFIPGSAQDLRAYFLVLQYWLAGSDDNVENMIRLLIDRYADGPRKGLRGKVPAAAPIDYPDVGLYHPRLPERITETASRLPASGGARVGLIVLRSYLLASDTRHYDGVIAALEARGLTVVPAFASGLDSRPAIERFFLDHGRPTVDAVISLTGFSLVGGPAYNDSAAAEATLVQLDVPYIAAHPLEFQTLEEWGASGRGLLPVENTIMVAIPEIDGAIQPTVFGGRAAGAGEPCTGCDRLCRFPANRDGREMQACPERAATLAARVDRLIGLRRRARAERKVGIVLFNFPPNAGNTGTAAYLAVFESLFNTLTAMAAAGYSVEVPEDVDALRHRILDGNAARYGTTANVAHRIPAADHVRREPHLAEIEAQWGPAPAASRATAPASSSSASASAMSSSASSPPSAGRATRCACSSRRASRRPTPSPPSIATSARISAPTPCCISAPTAPRIHAGKQAGLSARSWPDRLIGDLPNFYLYAANNPSEGALAKRRSAATLVSYRTPALTQAGLYRGLLDLKASIDRWRLCDPVDVGSRKALAELIQAQASAVELCPASPAFTGNLDVIIAKLAADVLELEYALIPHGLHVVGRAAGAGSAWTSSPASARRATASRRTATRLPPSSAARASSGRSQATASPPTTPPARPGRSSPPPTGCSPPRPRSVASSPPSTAPSSAPPPAATC